jgi:hypothetical protein
MFLTSRERRKLLNLKSRLAYMELKKAEWNGEQSGKAWDRIAGEAAALDWAIGLIEAMDEGKDGPDFGCT